MYPATFSISAALRSLEVNAGVPIRIPEVTIGDSGSKNAALFAIRIIALEDSLVASKLNQYIKKMEKAVPEKPKK